MSWVLICEGEGGRRFHLTDGEHRLGSHGSCALHLPAATVSRFHAQLIVEGGRVEIEDLGSRNGTHLGSRRLTQRTAIAAGSPLAFGSVQARLELLAAEDAEPAWLFTDSGPWSASELGDPASGTASLEPLARLVLDTLPALLDDFVTLPPTVFAERVGHALGGVLDLPITARREGAEQRLHATLPNAATRQLYGPLIDAMSALLTARQRCAQPPKKIATPPTATPPPLPAPSTAVPALQALYAAAARVARGDISVLILGETGTGKELFARYLHAASPRADGPFVALNCAALPADLLEAELFGVEGGTATGVEARPGKLELAHGGTLFLDELGDAHLTVQAKLLRALEEKQVFRLGASAPQTVDVRLLSATHHDVEALLRDGALRSDFYYRLADWTAKLPPLRHRQPDFPRLAAHFLTTERRRLGRRIRGISRGAMEALQRYPWPGNVRQLEGEMKRAVLLVGRGEMLQTTHLSSAIRDTEERAPRGLQETLRSAEHAYITRMLETCGGDRRASAARLGISEITLYRRLRGQRPKPGSGPAG